MDGINEYLISKKVFEVDEQSDEYLKQYAADHEYLVIKKQIEMKMNYGMKLLEKEVNFINLVSDDDDTNKRIMMVDNYNQDEPHAFVISKANRGQLVKYVKLSIAMHLIQRDFDILCSNVHSNSDEIDRTR